MKTFIFTILSILTITQVIPQTKPNLDDFVKAIHKVETGGKVGKVLGDSGAALGPLQIHRVYWQDAVQYDKTIGGKYEDCADLNYSKKVVKAYLSRYVKKELEAGNWEVCARVHNGGLTGHKKQATIKYWEKVKRELNKYLK